LTAYGELSVFDLSITKLLFLAVIALVVFGPNELPRIARQAGRALRDLRRIAEGAKADLREGLGPEFQDFDFEDLNPKRFVTKHLFEDTADTTQESAVAAISAMTAQTGAQAVAHVPNGKAVPGDTVSTVPATGEAVDDRPPFDLEAT
jgi:sec-independent protein translocase protein TatB